MYIRIGTGVLLWWVVFVLCREESHQKITWTGNNPLSCQNCSCTHSVANCRDNLIESFSHFLPTSLSAIDLSYNLLKKLADGTFLSNANLRWIDISGNQLTQLSENLFAGLHQLEYLNMSYNCLQYASIPTGVFQGLNHLKILSMNNQGACQNSVNPGTFAPLTSVEELHMTGTPSLDSSFSSMVNLTLLNFGDVNCVMPDLSIATYKPWLLLTRISRLSLRNCRIEAVENGFFNLTMHSLTRLDVSLNSNRYRDNNLIQDLTSTGSNNLRVLLLDGMKKFGNTSFDKNTYLFTETEQKLNLEAILLRYPNITALSIKYNHFVPLKKRLHVLVPHLRYLAIENSLNSLLSLERGHDEAAEPNIALDVLRLRNLQIVDFASTNTRTFALDNSVGRPHPLIANPNYPWDTLEQIPQPVCNEECFQSILIGIGIAVTTEPKDGRIQRSHFRISPLRIVKLSHISSSGRDVFSCKSHENFTVYLDEFYSINTKSYDRRIDLNCNILAPKLKKLSLKGCQLTYISSHVLHGFPALSNLDLSQNSLGKYLSSDVHGEIFKASKMLRIVNLSVNNIRELPERIFHGLTGLEELDLSNNAITQWTASLYHSRQLTILNLLENSLSAFNEKAVDTLLPPGNSNATDTHYTQIDLSIQTIACDCSETSLFFTNWILKPSKNLVISSGTTQPVDYQCKGQMEMSVAKWAAISYSECEASSTEDLLPIMIGVPSAILTFFVALSLLGYIYRYSLLYSFYKWRSRQRMNLEEQLRCIMPIFGDSDDDNDLADDCNIQVYVVGDGNDRPTEMMCEYLANIGSRFYTRDLASQASGYRWQNVVKDIGSADAVVIILTEKCFDDDNMNKDFHFSLEKGWGKIVTLRCGSIASILKGSNGRLIQKLLQKSSDLEWKCTTDGQLDREFLEHFTAALQEARRKKN